MLPLGGDRTIPQHFWGQMMSAFVGATGEFPAIVEGSLIGPLGPTSYARVNRLVPIVLSSLIVLGGATTSNVDQSASSIAQRVADQLSTNGIAARVPESDLAAPRGPTQRSAVRSLHDSSGLTWEQLARLFGVSRRAVHNWANG